MAKQRRGKYLKASTGNKVNVCKLCFSKSTDK